MGKGNESDTSWWMILFLFVVLPLAFTLGGVWIGAIVFLVGALVAGWNKKHDGPFQYK